MNHAQFETIECSGFALMETKFPLLGTIFYTSIETPLDTVYISMCKTDLPISFKSSGWMVDAAIKHSLSMTVKQIVTAEIALKSVQEKGSHYLIALLAESKSTHVRSPICEYSIEASND